MGALKSRVRPGNSKVSQKSIVNPNEKIEEAIAARRAKDFKLASFLYEEAAVASVRVGEPLGISAAYYVEAANCAEADFLNRKESKRDSKDSKDSKNSKDSKDSKEIESQNHAPASATITATSNPGEEMRRVMLLLENAAAQHIKAKRSNQAADVYKRMAILYEEELQDFSSALKYYEQASTDYDLANFFNNAVDCDLQRANLFLKSNPLQSLAIYKAVVNKYINKQMISSARPLVYKIILLTGSLYDIQTAKKTSDSYTAMNRTFGISVDLRNLNDFFDALEEEDVKLVDNMIEEARDPWAKEILVKMKQDSGISDELNLT